MIRLFLRNIHLFFHTSVLNFNYAATHSNVCPCINFLLVSDERLCLNSLKVVTEKIKENKSLLGRCVNAQAMTSVIAGTIYAKQHEVSIHLSLIELKLGTQHIICFHAAKLGQRCLINTWLRINFGTSGICINVISFSTLKAVNKNFKH